MNLWISIGIALLSAMLGFLVGKVYYEKYYEMFTGSMINQGSLFFKDGDGVWQGEPEEMAERLNKMEKEFKPDGTDKKDPKVS
jgi:hypothetical protein